MNMFQLKGFTMTNNYVRDYIEIDRDKENDQDEEGLTITRSLYIFLSF